MPDTTTTVERDTAIAFLVGLITTVVGNVAARKAVETAGRFVEKKIEERIYGHKEARGLLAMDVASMDKKDTKVFMNRMHQAQLNDWETRFMRLLNTVPRDPQTGWQQLIKYMNYADRRRFLYTLDMLEHDDLHQMIRHLIERVRKTGVPLGEQDRKELATLAKANWDKKMVGAVDSAAGFLAKPLGAFADAIHWINNRQGGVSHD